MVGENAPPGLPEPSAAVVARIFAIPSASATPTVGWVEAWRSASIPFPAVSGTAAMVSAAARAGTATAHTGPRRSRAAMATRSRTARMLTLPMEAGIIATAPRTSSDP